MRTFVLIIFFIGFSQVLGMNITQLSPLSIVSKFKNKTDNNIGAFARERAKTLDDYVINFNKESNETNFFEQLLALETNKEENSLSDEIHKIIISHMKTSVPLVKVKTNNECAYSPTKKYKLNLVTGDISMYGTNKKIGHIPNIQDYSFLFSPKENFVIFQKKIDSHNLILINLHTSKIQTIEPLPDNARYNARCQFSPDETLLLYIMRDSSGVECFDSISQYKIKIFQTKNGQMICEEGDAKDAYFSDDMLYMNCYNLLMRGKNVWGKKIFKITKKQDCWAITKYNCFLDKNHIFKITFGENATEEINGIHSYDFCMNTNTILLFTKSAAPHDTIKTFYGLSFTIVQLDEDTKYSISPKGNYLFHYSKNTDDNITFLNLFDIKKQALNQQCNEKGLISDYHRNPDQVSFNADETMVLFINDNRLHCYDIKNKTTSVSFDKSIYMFQMHPTHNIVYALSGYNKLILYDFDQKKLPPLSSDNIISPQNKDTEWVINFDIDKKLVLLGNGSIIINAFTGEKYIDFPNIYFTHIFPDHIGLEAKFPATLLNSSVKEFIITDSSGTIQGSVGFTYQNTIFCTIIYALASKYEWKSIEQFPNWLKAIIDKQSSSEQSSLAKNLHNLCNINKTQNEVKQLEQTIKQRKKRAIILWYLHFGMKYILPIFIAYWLFSNHPFFLSYIH